MPAKIFVDTNIWLYSYPDRYCPEYVGRAVRALAPKACCARLSSQGAHSTPYSKCPYAGNNSV